MWKKDYIYWIISMLSYSVGNFLKIYECIDAVDSNLPNYMNFFALIK